jgi:hypothetical protein
VVAFNGVQGRAHDASVQSDLRQIGQKLEAKRAEVGSYPTPANSDMAQIELSASKAAYHSNWFDGSTVNLLYCHPQSGSTFALLARSRSGKAFMYNGRVSEYSGDTSGGTPELCSRVGAPTANTGAAERTFFREPPTVWASWVR